MKKYNTVRYRSYITETNCKIYDRMIMISFAKNQNEIHAFDQESRLKQCTSVLLLYSKIDCNRRRHAVELTRRIQNYLLYRQKRQWYRLRCEADTIYSCGDDWLASTDNMEQGWLTPILHLCQYMCMHSSHMKFNFIFFLPRLNEACSLFCTFSKQNGNHLIELTLLTDVFSRISN